MAMYESCVAENIVFSFILNECTSCYGKSNVFKADLKLNTVWDALDLSVGSQKLLMTVISIY